MDINQLIPVYSIGTLQDIYPLLKSEIRYIRVRVRGRCMEGANIFENDIATIDLQRFPRLPQTLVMDGKKKTHYDPCLCFMPMDDKDITQYMQLKAYCGAFFHFQTVKTQYTYEGTQEENVQLNYMIHPSLIAGVVCKVENEEGIRWEINTDSFPKELEQTYRAINCNCKGEKVSQ